MFLNFSIIKFAANQAFDGSKGVFGVRDRLAFCCLPNDGFAFACDRGHQVRYLAVRPARPDEIKEIEFKKGEIAMVAPMIIALTVEKPS